MLQGKKGIIFGALDDASIAWKVAQECKKAGAKFTLTNAPVALRMGKINELAEEMETIVISADATRTDDLENLIDKSIEHLGGKLDFVLHSIGMSPNVRKKKPYTDLNYDWYLKTLDISSVSFHKVLQTCYKKDAINEYGSVIALSYIAAQRAFPFYNDMAEAKSTLESIARSFGYHYGKFKKVRVNTISQSPTFTTAGKGVGEFDKFFAFADKMAPLGNASAEDCAKFCVAMFSDFTRSITMQNLMHDGGFSTCGISEEIIEGLV